MITNPALYNVYTTVYTVYHLLYTINPSYRTSAGLCTLLYNKVLSETNRSNIILNKITFNKIYYWKPRLEQYLNSNNGLRLS